MQASSGLPERWKSHAVANLWFHGVHGDQLFSIIRKKIYIQKILKFSNLIQKIRTSQGAYIASTLHNILLFLI